MSPWQVALRYSWADFTDGGIEGGAAESVTLGLNWLWTAHSTLQPNYIRARPSERTEAANSDMARFRLRYAFLPHRTRPQRPREPGPCP